MKKVLIATATFLLSVSALADTVSQKTAKGMVSALQSKEVQALLSQEDGVGNFKGIKYLFSYRAITGPAIYELSFVSNSGPSPQLCTVPVAVNIQTLKVVKVSKAECKETN